MPSKGYLYVATGEQFVEEALRSLESLRRCSPDAHATLITDREISVPEFDLVKVIESEMDHDRPWKYGTVFKVTALQASPYEKTFFIDTDTYFCHDCSELFELLEYFDLLICHAPGDVSEVEVDGRSLAGYYPYNTGVMVYNNTPALHAFYQDWSRCYQRKVDAYQGNQPPFMEALLRHHINTYVLQTVYNFRTPYLVAFVGKRVKIIHGRMKDYPRTERILNKSTLHRVWIPWKQKVIVEDDPLSYKILDRLYRVTPGFMKTAYRGVKGWWVSREKSIS